MSVIELLGSVLTELEEIHKKLDRLLASSGSLKFKNKTMVVDEAVEMFEELIEISEKESTNFALPMTGKYQWYRFADHEGKVRKCENEGCDLFLLWNKDKKKYEHWKYDPNTGIGGFVQDKCDHYGGF